MGYFNFFYKLTYIFNFLKRNKKLFVILLLAIVLFFFLNNNKSQAFEGDFSYSDNNSLMIKVQNDICLEFLRRFEQVPDDNVYKQNFLNTYTKGSYFKPYFYLGNADGSSVINGSPLNTTSIYCVFINNENNEYTISSSPYNNYFGIDNIDLKTLTFTPAAGFIHVFKFSYSSLSKVALPQNSTLTLPTYFLQVGSEYFYDYFYNNYSIEQIETLQEMNEKIDNIENTLTDDTISQEATDNIENSIEDISSNFDTGYTDNFKSYENSFLSEIRDLVDELADGTTTRRVTFTLPYVNQNIVLRGDLISSKIRNTTLYTYIQLFWWVAFCIPIYGLLRRIVLWFGTGEFINSPSKFALYISDFVSKNITPGMM